MPAHSPLLQVQSQDYIVTTLINQRVAYFYGSIAPDSDVRDCRFLAAQAATARGS